MVCAGEDAVTPDDTDNPPSHETVLEGLRRVCYRQVVRYRDEPVFDALVEMGFIVWVRQDPSLSQQQMPAGSRSYRAPVEVAVMGATGHTALNWLAHLEQSPQWPVLRALPYGAMPVSPRSP
jgi:hypothetical protein